MDPSLSSYLQSIQRTEAVRFWLVLFLAVFATVYWMIVGWRAMKAHESIARAQHNLADAVDRLADRSGPQPATPPQEPLVTDWRQAPPPRRR